MSTIKKIEQGGPPLPAHLKPVPLWQEDAIACLRAPGMGSSTIRLNKRDVIFYQAMPADCLFYLLKGRAKLTTVSPEGKEATIALLNAGDFLGEECISEGQILRTTTALAISECTVLRTERKAVLEILRHDARFLNFFLSFIVARNVRMQEDLVDRLFHTSEKRLARVLIMLAGFENTGQSEILVPKISQETLAEIVGTTRSRISFFMNTFRKQGLIDYDGDYSGNILVRSSLKSVISQTDERGSTEKIRPKSAVAATSGT
ncbi:MAG TPA: Crp/Fnr family transcriptional regulator [Candidatus Angelobacter sp.]|nr:Crp/Fnr family transcriptional regulator [Candidatus Angelobacter sp.]